MGWQAVDARSGGLEVVHERHRHAEFRLERIGIDDPIAIGEARAPAVDGSCNAEARGCHCAAIDRLLRKERVDRGLESRKVGVGLPRFVDPFDLAVGPPGKRKPRVGRTDIADEVQPVGAGHRESVQPGEGRGLCQPSRPAILSASRGPHVPPR